MPPHAWDFLIFKEGSWWVYKEEKTSEMDSIWVKSFERNLDPATAEIRICGCGGDSCLEKVRMAFASSRYKNQDLYTRDLITYFTRGKLFVFDSSEVLDKLPQQRFEYGNDKYYKNMPFNGWGENYGVYEDMDSIMLEGKVYKDILHHRYHKQIDADIYDWMDESWYARNIYLVRYRLQDGTVWNLVKYNIVK